MNRKASFSFTLAFLLLMCLYACNPNHDKREIAPAFCHHVYFYLNDPTNESDRAAFEKGVADLLEIPEIKAWHVGVPAHTADRSVVDASYTYSYLVFFEDEAAHDIYQDHPLHQKFIDDCSHLWSKVVVYDSVVLNK